MRIGVDYGHKSHLGRWRPAFGQARTYAQDAHVRCLYRGPQECGGAARVGVDLRTSGARVSFLSRAVEAGGVGGRESPAEVRRRVGA